MGLADKISKCGNSFNIGIILLVCIFPILDDQQEFTKEFD